MPETLDFNLVSLARRAVAGLIFGNRIAAQKQTPRKQSLSEG